MFIFLNFHSYLDQLVLQLVVRVNDCIFLETSIQKYLEYNDVSVGFTKNDTTKSSAVDFYTDTIHSSATQQ